MLDENKAVADLRQFINSRVAKGRVLNVDQIGLLFLAISEDAQVAAYAGVSASDLEPFVKVVVAEFLLDWRDGLTPPDPASAISLLSTSTAAR
jgi:hypothetical protein